MSTYDLAEAAFRKVIDDNEARLGGLFEVAEAEKNSALATLSAEKAAHLVTKGLLDAANARIAAQDAYIQELLAQIEVPHNLFKPISFKTLEEAIEELNAPRDAKYVTWRWGDDVMLEQAFMEMSPGEILVLPEREKPYLIDSADGFRAAGVTLLRNGSVDIPIKNTYRGRTARTWFALARSQRGVLGLGPGAVIEIAPSAFKMGRQAEQKTMGYVTTGGVYKALTSATMRLIETADNQRGYYANFTIRGRDLGGVAYSAISLGNAGGEYTRVDNQASARGFLYYPNGETGAISINGGDYYIHDVEISGRDSFGARVMTTPIMVNHTTGGKLENVYIHETLTGPSISVFQSSGLHHFKNLRTEFASGINLEDNYAGVEVLWEGGTDYIDYLHGGEWPDMPDADMRGNKSLHIGMRSPRGSQKLTIKGVKFDKGPKPGYVSVQVYYGNIIKNGVSVPEPRLQLASDIKVFDDKGATIPVQTHGVLAMGQ